MADGVVVLDLSKQSLKKVPKQDDAQMIRVLILDDNDLQKIDNIDSYLRIEKLSLCKNQLLRMYGVCRLHQLQELHLANNGILTIEGLKELTQLVHLNLEGNNIKTIEHLNTNIKLEYLNLSENSIGNISDISYLKSLKELHLHGNRITHLRQCEKNLPVSLEILSLTKNSLTDLNEICSLINLVNIQSISIADNPCVQLSGNVVGFDYRPFVLNWCMSATVIDGFVVSPIESLKAEWLYSQGRGRQFRLGEQDQLARYLSSVCPLSGEVLENENERKLRLILSKAQQHQRQLQEEISDNVNTSGGNSPSSGRRKGQSSRIQSPRFSRLGGRQGSPDSMSSSYHGNTSSCSLLSSHTDSRNGNGYSHMSSSLITNIQNEGIMSQSLDPQILAANNNKSLMSSSMVGGHFLSNHQLNGGPLVAASKMVPVPESLMSPDCPIAAPLIHRSSLNSTNQHHTPSIMTTSSYIQSVQKSNSKPKDKRVSSPKINRQPVISTSNKKLDKSPHMSNSRRTPTNNITANPSTKQHYTSHNNSHSSIDNYQSRIKFGNSLSQHNNKASPPPSTHDGGSSSDDSEHINMDKLKLIKTRAAQRVLEIEQERILRSPSLPINKTVENSVILIQKMWRGYRTRQKTKEIASILQKKRTEQYIEKLTHDMETTKVALENERKIQQLQMQAINALWKKVSTMQTANNTTSAPATSTSVDNRNSAPTLDSNPAVIVQDLAKTCTVLTNEVHQLQGSMRDIIQCMTMFLPQQNNNFRQPSSETKTKDVRDSCSTQTEIIAVHTPQVENPPFPFKKSTSIIGSGNNKLQRPSTLPLDSRETSPLPLSNFTSDAEANTSQTDDNLTPVLLSPQQQHKSESKNDEIISLSSTTSPMQEKPEKITQDNNIDATKYE